MDNSIIPIIKELERIYDALSIKFEIKHTRPVITIQTKGRAKILGWHSADRWEQENKTIGEINICAENLKDNPIETLVHEMSHHINSCEKIEDCNLAGYHNVEFKKRAESLGLIVEKMGRHGWAKTSISDRLQEILKEIKPDTNTFKLYRIPNLRFVNPTKMKKYSCGCTTVRCAVELNAKCLNCNNQFIKKEKDE